MAISFQLAMLKYAWKAIDMEYLITHESYSSLLEGYYNSPSLWLMGTSHLRWKSNGFYENILPASIRKEPAKNEVLYIRVLATAC